ncbi:hypothetical protein [Paenibacillus thalictri]|uniref:Uncharacterized protein n=1 Tax=Paenibacillus thalictri TaxID=2527873 RepID=A0A4Q9DDP2_9BACL|nr:hypothetical protein [Paenibacillus thalictri]TBL67464.1 hypothetical protein EYB31_39700 [Paenibacillus thalictri]
MKNIKNFELIRSEINVFNWINFKFIIDFHFFKDLNKFFEEIPTLDLYVEYKDSQKTYVIKIRFKGINNLNISCTCDYGIQLSGFEVIDIKEDGWIDLNYKVIDYETEDIKFYCKEIEVISINVV